MNRPIIRIVATDGKAYPLAPAAAPIVPANNGAAATPSHGAQPSNLRAATGEAEGFSPVPSVSPTFVPEALSGDAPVSKTGEQGSIPCGGAPNSQPCIPCEGKGERQWLAYDETEWRWHICEDCDGTGYAKKPYCSRCGSNLTCDLYCTDCDDWASLVYVERIAPGRVAL